MGYNLTFFSPSKKNSLRFASKFNQRKFFMCKRRSTDYRLLEQLEGPQININFNLDLGASKTRQYLKKLPTTQTKVFLCTSSFITHLDEISDD